MKSKLIKFIIGTLLIVLSITSIFTYKSYEINKQVKLQQNINNKTKQEQNLKIVNKNILIQTLNKENSMNVLSGTVEVQASYSDKNISDDDVNMKFLRDCLAYMNSKDIKVDYNYDYTFSYNLKDLPVKIINNTVSKCELSKENNVSDRVGILTSKFTPQQINSINSRTRDLAFNRVQSDEELRTKAIEELQGNIKDLIKPFLNKDTSIYFNLSCYDVIQQDDLIIK